MNTQFHPCDAISHSVVERAYLIGGSISNRVGKRYASHADVFQPHQSVFDDLGAPRLVVRIAERHGDVDDQVVSRSFGGFSQILDKGARFAARHIRIRAAKISGDGVGITDRRYAWSLGRT